MFFYYIIGIFFILTIALFAINLLKEKSNQQKEKKAQMEQKEEKNIIEYKANQTIRVRFSKTGEIVAMDINDYLRGVVPSEMSPTYHIEALKAQALVARTYTYEKMGYHAEGEDADMCDNFAHCQAFYPKEKLFEIWRKKGYDENTILEFWDKINEAVVSTQNEIITYQDKCIKAFFHASSPEKTEDISQIWGGQNLPYLKAVANEEDEDYVNRNSTVEVTYDDFVAKTKEIASMTKEQVKKIKIGEYTTSGRVKNIDMDGIRISAEKLRNLFGLKSTNFTLETTNETVIFHVIGYGHGIGLSQVGANYDAKNGMNYQDIIKHYYTDVQIKKLK